MLSKIKDTFTNIILFLANVYCHNFTLWEGIKRVIHTRRENREIKKLVKGWKGRK